MTGVIHTFVSNIVPGLAGLAATGIVGVIMFPVRTFIQGAREEWKAATSKLDALQKELETQRTNCLTTLTAQGEAQIKLLEKTVGTLEAMHLDQKEVMGYLRNKA